MPRICSRLRRPRAQPASTQPACAHHPTSIGVGKSSRSTPHRARRGRCSPGQASVGCVVATAVPEPATRAFRGRTVAAVAVSAGVEVCEVERALPTPTARLADAATTHAVNGAALVDDESRGSAPVRWVPVGEPLRIGPGTAERGGLYVGSSSPPVADTPRQPEACLIRPTLEVDWRRPDDKELEYRPSYSRLSPQSRAGYLRWLFDGCQHPEAPVGFVFLYFYGLEWRLLQVAVDPQSRSERDALLAEVQRLLVLYGHHSALRRYLQGVTDVVRAVASHPLDTGELAEVALNKALPFPVKLAVGRLVTQGQPLPAEYALAWWQADPTSPHLAAFGRCPTEFRELFAHLYRQRHGNELVVQRSSRRLTAFYRAASPDLPDGYLLKTDAADVGALSHDLSAWTQVRQVVDETARQLRPYSRLLAAQPDQERTPRAAALLPAALRRPGDPRVQALLAWAEDHLTEADAVMVRLEELPDAWGGPEWTSAALTGLSRLLAEEGVGIEPDPALDRRSAKVKGRVVLYRRPARDQTVRTDEDNSDFPLAAVLLQLLTEVTGTNGCLTDIDLVALPERVGAAVDLNETQRARLRAVMLQLNEQPVPVAVLRRRLRALTEQQQAIGRELLRQIPQDHRVRPGRVSIDAWLLDALADTRIHDDVKARHPSTAAPSRALTDDALVSVRTAGVPAPEFALPARSERTVDATNGTVALDRGLIETIERSTALVEARLAELFRDDEPPRIAPPPSVCLPEPDLTRPVVIAGLDVPHTGLLLDLADQLSWTSSDLGRLCAAHELLPAGALDRLNEAALDRTGALVCDGTDPVLIDLDILKEML